MGKEEIISYVMETPGNTNPNVLRSLLDSDGGILDLEEGLVKFFAASSDLQIHGGFGFSGRFVAQENYADRSGD